MIKNRINQFKQNPRFVFAYLLTKTPINRLFCSDELYLKLLCWCYLGYWINLKNPRTFNEKTQWLKLYAHRPIYSKMADKLAAKEIVRGVLGTDAYVVPCYGNWGDAKDICFDELPNQFVLKCNHNSGGGSFICKDKTKINEKEIRKNLNKALRSDFSRIGRDKQYRDIQPRRIIADMLLDDGSGHELTDYKWWCVNGVPKLMYITNKGEHVYENFYDMDFNPVEINHSCPRRKPEYEKPEAFEDMKTLASKLSTGIPFVRIDFFYVEGKIYFGEYTFFDWGGFNPFDSYETDIRLGDLIQLPNLGSR